MTESAYFTTLPNRGLIRVSGPERRTFLQGLISNDINLLDTQPCVYACLLTAQGKFLHDFFATEKDEIVSLDCEGGARAEDLAKRLKMFKLRSKVEIECVSEILVYASFQRRLESILQSTTSLPMDPGPSLSSAKAGGRDDDTYIDPRHSGMGWRSFKKPVLQEVPFDEWDRHRILLTVPDGSRDMIPEQSTLLECNIDKLGGVSFEKGCYVGQELTARMHHRNLGKKHLYTVQGNFPPEVEIRSRCGDVAIVLMKDNLVDNLKD